MNRIERIQAMEALMDECAEAVAEFEAAMDRYRAVRPKLRRLSRYYGSGAWHADRTADEKGRLPEALKRGVLSEDLVYDVLLDHRNNAVEMLELGADIVRRL